MVGVNMEKTSNESEKMFFLIKIPYNIVKYFCKGVYTTTFILLDIIKHFIKYFLCGYVTISYFVYRLLSLPFKLLGKIFKYQTKDEAREAMLKRRAERAEAIRKQKEQGEAYVNKNVKIEKHDFNWLINKIFNGIAKLPNNIINAFKNAYQNTTFYKNAKNKADINRQALLLSFEGADAEKSEVKLVYEYVAKDPTGKTVKGYFEAFSKVEVHSFLLSEGYEVYSIRTDKWIQFY